MMRVIESLAYWFYVRGQEVEEHTYKDVKVFVVKKLVPKWAAGQAIGNYIFVSATVGMGSRKLLCHEYTHVQQWRRYGAIGFLARYYGSYLYHLVRTRDSMKAYFAIPLEIEAYDKQNHC